MTSWPGQPPPPKIQEHIKGRKRVMIEEIYLNELDCPHCDWDQYNESWDIDVDQDSKEVTGVTCENCGKIFYVHTELSVVVRKEK